MPANLENSAVGIPWSQSNDLKGYAPAIAGTRDRQRLNFTKMVSNVYTNWR